MSSKYLHRDSLESLARYKAVYSESPYGWTKLGGKINTDLRVNCNPFQTLQGTNTIFALFSSTLQSARISQKGVVHVPCAPIFMSGASVFIAAS